MASTTRSLLSLSYQSALYGIGRYGRTLIVYLTLPLLIRWMGRGEYGIVVVLTAFINLVDIVSDAGLPMATMRLYNERNEASYRASVLGSSLVLFLGSALAMAVAIWLFAGTLAGQLLQHQEDSHLIRMGATLMLLMTVFSFGDILYRIQVRPLMQSLANLLLITLQTVLALLAVGFFHLGAQGYVGGQIVGAALAIVFMLVTLRKSLAFAFSKVEARALLIYALPLIPAVLAGWALVSVDRLIIPQFLGFQGVAIYDVGYKIAGLAHVAFVPILLAWPQFAFGHMRDENAARIFRDVLTGVAAVSTLVALIIYALRWELVLRIGGPEYVRAVGVIGWVLVGQVALTLFPILAIGPRISKRTGKIAWIVGIAAGSNVFLNYLLIPRFGLVGAGMATGLAYAIQAALAYMLGRREFAFDLDSRRLAGLALAAAAVSGSVYLVETTWGHSSLSLILRILSLLLFPALLLCLGFVRPGQIRDLLRIALEQLQRRMGGSDYGSA